MMLMSWWLEPIDKRQIQKASIVEEVLFEGIMVLGTQILMNCQNQCHALNQTIESFEQYNGVALTFKMVISSLVLVWPCADNLNITELKQSKSYKGLPDGIAIDIDALAEIDLGDGKKQTVQQTLNMYLQKVVTSTVLLLLAEILIMLKNHFKN
jgi:hypothetical protein